MDAAGRERLEVELTALHARGAHDAVAAQAILGYGPELLGLLVSLHGESDGQELFQQLWEDAWRGLPGFERRASFRTWLYTLARHAAFRFMRGELRRRRRQVDPDDASQVARLEAAVRERTLPHLRTEQKSAWRALRDELPPDDQLLLVLRVDRELDWNDIAAVFLSEDAADDAALTREAARLRKRFQLVKERLRDLGRERGLISDSAE